MGVSVYLITDMDTSLIGLHKDFQKFTKKNKINLTYSEAGRHNQLNKVDIKIKKVKGRWHNKMANNKSSEKLWCFGLEYWSK